MSRCNYLRRLAFLSPILVAGCSAPLTGTPLDLTPLGGVFAALGVVYWLVGLGVLWFAVAYSPSRQIKVVAGLVVVAGFAYFPLTYHAAKTQVEGAGKARFAKANAMFQERCKTAGEKIYRTAENVDGILLMKVRPKVTGLEFDDQYGMHDPYGRDLGGDGYIETFVRGFETRQSQFAPGAPPRLGYRYVEAVDPKDGKRYRYTGSIKVVGRKDRNSPNNKIDIERNPNFDLNIYAFTLDKTSAPGQSPRYGVTYDDISTREEREYWIAGSSLKVVDLKTNEVIAERIGYMMDPGQGATGGGRSPWLMAADNACPTFQRNPLRPLEAGHGASAQSNQTEDFVEKVLKPILEK